MRRLVFFSFILGACAASLPQATPADAQRAAERYPGITTADLAGGRTLFVSHCSACHLAPDPRSKSPAEWHDKLDEMKTRAHLDDAQAARVERYLVTIASRTSSPN